MAQVTAAPVDAETEAVIHEAPWKPAGGTATDATLPWKAACAALTASLVACIAVIASSAGGGGGGGGGNGAAASSYVGARDQCLMEVPDAAQCPDAFPTWSEAGERAPACGLAVVGAGAGGLYAARRLVADGQFAARDVCVFEATERVGGRTYSVRYADLDLAVDAGAYRTWPEYTPVTHALITDWLGLTVACYDPAEDPCEKFIVVDAVTGHNAGLATYVEKLANDLFEEGARWFPRHQLVALAPASGGGDDARLKLTFANGVAAEAASVLLNVPQRPLLEVLRMSSEALALDRATFDAAHAVQTEIVQKLYLYYEAAWWRELGLVSGDFTLAGDATNMLLKGRYHDGDVVCDADGANCRGFLLAVYEHDYAGETAMFFRRYQRDRPEPISIISGATPEGAAFLEHAHDRLLEYHTYAAVDGNASYTPYEANEVVGNAPPPTFAVLATWNIATLGAGGGWHGWTDLALADAMPAALAAHGAYVVNEAYSKVQGWAEGSLQAADRVLEDHFGLARPWDFPDSPYPIHLAQTQPTEHCDDGTTAAASGGGGAAAGGGSDDVLCFSGDAPLLLADGTAKNLSAAAVGDRVRTGFGDEVGVVTAVLVHPVPGGAAELIAVGDGFLGTRSHPVHVDGIGWVELADAGLSDLGPRDVSIDTLYNLEIDGDEPGVSNHSYVVGDLVASGNGDGHLNELFPRQKVWGAAPP